MPPKVTEAGLLEATSEAPLPFSGCAIWREDHIMAPLGILTSGLQILSSWLMSVLAMLALFVSVIICLIFLEAFLDRREIRGAYTVKPMLPNAPSQRSPQGLGVRNR